MRKAVVLFSMLAVLLVGGCAGNAPSKIVGKWGIQQGGEAMTYEFLADGSFTADFATGPYASGTYVVQGDKLTLTTSVGGKTTEGQIRWETDDRFTVTGSSGSPGTFIRQK